MKYLISNKEIYVVYYQVEAESIEEAAEIWVDSGEEIDMEYFCDLSDYTNKSIPFIQEIKEV